MQTQQGKVVFSRHIIWTGERNATKYVIDSQPIRSIGQQEYSHYHCSIIATKTFPQMDPAAMQLPIRKHIKYKNKYIPHAFCIFVYYLHSFWHENTQFLFNLYYTPKRKSFSPCCSGGDGIRHVKILNVGRAPLIICTVQHTLRHFKIVRVCCPRSAKTTCGGRPCLARFPSLSRLHT